MRPAVCSSAGGVGRTSTAALLAQHRDDGTTSAELLGVACSRGQGRRGRSRVVEAPSATDLPVLQIRVPLSRQVRCARSLSAASC